MWAAGLVGSSIGMIPRSGVQSPNYLLREQSCEVTRSPIRALGALGESHCFFSMLLGWNWKRGWFIYLNRISRMRGWSLLLPLFGVILKDRNLRWNGKNIYWNQTLLTSFAWMLVMLGCECDIPALLFMQLRGLPTGSVVQFHTAWGGTKSSWVMGWRCRH